MFTQRFESIPICSISGNPSDVEPPDANPMSGGSQLADRSSPDDGSKSKASEGNVVPTKQRRQPDVLPIFLADKHKI